MSTVSCLAATRTSPLLHPLFIGACHFTSTAAGSIPFTLFGLIVRGPLASLGAFAELRKAAVSFVMSVRQSAWNKSTPTGRILVKSDI
jgi:hypothetical protein